MGANAFNILLVKRFFDNLPREIFEAAKTDGAGPFRLFWSIVLPMSKPILGVVSVFAIIAAWKDYLWPMLVLPDPAVQPLSVRLPGGAVPDRARRLPRGARDRDADPDRDVPAVPVGVPALRRPRRRRQGLTAPRPAASRSASRGRRCCGPSGPRRSEPPGSTRVLTAHGLAELVAVELHGLRGRASRPRRRCRGSSDGVVLGAQREHPAAGAEAAQEAVVPRHAAPDEEPAERTLGLEDDDVERAVGDGCLGDEVEPAGSEPQFANRTLCTRAECRRWPGSWYMTRNGFAFGSERAAPST